MMAATRIREIGVVSAALLVIVSAGTRSRAQSQSASPTGEMSKLRILYAGHPGSDREKDFVGFLKKYFDVVQAGNLQTFKEADTEGYDVTILDYDGDGFKAPRPMVSAGFSKPLITVGVAGGLICDRWGLKTGYLWNCMGDAAHAELLNHEVYRTPFAVRPDFQFRKTPHNYRYYNLGPDKLPDQMKVWLVQKTGKDVGGVVAWGDGFTDSPDAEILALGFNDGKAYGSVGISRQGNFLQWGYSAPPSQMTDAGRTLFLNCIHYVRKFDGKAPLLRRRAGPRTNVVILARIINRIINEDPREFFLHTFPEELYEKYHADPNGLAAYYQANLELVYRDKVYRVDEELRSLGLASNRKVETLERLFELRKDPARGELAQRLLNRYTDGRTTYDFQHGRDRIYFSDVGGYKFFAVPEGYLTVQNSGAGTS